MLDNGLVNIPDRHLGGAGRAMQATVGLPATVTGDECSSSARHCKLLRELLHPQIHLTERAAVFGVKHLNQENSTGTAIFDKDQSDCEGSGDLAIIPLRCWALWHW